MGYSDWSDEELLNELKAIDRADEVDVTSWEANFMGSIFEKFPNPKFDLSLKQRNVIITMIEKYEGDY